MSRRPVPLFCPFCTVTQYATPMDGEHLFATKNRIRQAMGETCPKSAGRDKCPMRDKAKPLGIDGELAR